jgi:hypothetical protein
MKRYIIMFILISLLLTGSITQLYTHKVDALGDSRITESRNISFFLSLLPTDALQRINDICLVNSSLDCSLQNTTLTMSLDLESGNDYYSLTTDNGFPFVTTTLTINKIPTDLFDDRINSILLSSKLVSDEGSAKPIDLTDKSTNRAKAAALKSSGFEIAYSVEMPNKKVSNYDLVAILEDSKPIVVKTQEINSWTIALAVGIILVLFVSASFFGKKRTMKR